MLKNNSAIELTYSFIDHEVIKKAQHGQCSGCSLAVELTPHEQGVVVSSPFQLPGNFVFYFLIFHLGVL